MPQIDLVVSTPISTSVRVAQISSIFDIPPTGESRLEWHGELPIEEKPWNVGLIVGPSGCGKTTILNGIFGTPVSFEWSQPAVVDEFEPRHGIDAVTKICQAVGFNTIPAWLRPYDVLSTGEKFRVELARRLIESDAGRPVLCDEFTSVVDRQVAKIGAYAVQRYIRRNKQQFVAASCHYDLEDWLQPDWVFEPATMVFRWRSVQRRPSLQCTIERVPYEAWHMFSQYHFLSHTLTKAAKCFVLFVEDQPAGFLATLHRPNPAYKGIQIYTASRVVTLPDFQGLGVIFLMLDTIAGAFRALGKRFHMYPVHPGFIRAFDRSPNWSLKRKPGFRSSSNRLWTSSSGRFGMRWGALFAYCGPTMEDKAMAGEFLGM